MKSGPRLTTSSKWQRQSFSTLASPRARNAYGTTHYQALSVHGASFGRLLSYDGPKAKRKRLELVPSQAKARRDYERSLPSFGAEPEECLYDVCLGIEAKPNTPMPWWRNWVYAWSPEAPVIHKERVPKHRGHKGHTVWEYTDAKLPDSEGRLRLGPIKRVSLLKCDPGTHDMRQGPMPYDAKAKQRAELDALVAAFIEKRALAYVSYLTGGSAQ